MIEKLSIDSFNAISDDPKRSTSVIPLQPFTVLVGPNGSGKSTIL
ncbi:AAA family ATPase [Sorangium sp. So ce429]